MESSPGHADPLPSGLRVGVPSAVFLVSFLCFTPALGGAFLNWDDNLVLTDHDAWRGIARLQRREFAAAKEDLAEAIRLKPVEPDAWYVRGQARDEEGDLDGAIADYAQALNVGGPPLGLAKTRARGGAPRARQAA